ncbi:MAG: hypothetical protein NVS3B20_21420 [Polyangiales bacterium]
MRVLPLPLLACIVALYGACSDQGRMRCGHLYVADEDLFYAGGSYDPYYEDPSFWSFDDSYDEGPSDPGWSGDPGYGDPGYGDPGGDPGSYSQPNDEPQSLHVKTVPSASAPDSGHRTAPAPDANGCYACVLKCVVTVSGVASPKMANGVSAYGEDRACVWASRAIGAWANAHAATVGTCTRIDPRVRFRAAHPVIGDAGNG